VIVIDATNRQATYVYDADNELVQVVRPDGSALKTVYDGVGNVTQQIDGLGNATNYQYNALNQRKTMVDPLNRSTQYKYDGVGDLLTVQNPKDNAASYTMSYDPGNQLKTITYSDGHTPTVSYSYDRDGQRQQMTDGTGTTTYTFDSLHRLTQSTNGSNSQVQYGYDLAGHLTSLVYPSATGTVVRTYDDVGQLASVTDWLRNTTRFAYDPNGNLISQSYPNGAMASFTYDAADRLMQIIDAVGGNQFLNLTYARDAKDQLTSENSTTYGYDPNNRVTSAVSGGSPLTYGYDAADNLTKNINGPNTTTQVYDVANQLQTATTMNGSTLVQKYTYGYDSNGNRISRTDKNNLVTSYGWDQAKRLTNYGATVTYSYNGDSLRVSKTLSGSPELFVWNTAEGLPRLIMDGSTSFISGSSGVPLEQIVGTTVSFFHQDQLGSTRVLTASSGATVATYSYDAYGNVTGSTGTVTSQLEFAGQYVDAESGFQYLVARYYDPVSSQFTSRDPLANVTNLPYGYSANAPTNATDANGLDWGWIKKAWHSTTSAVSHAWSTVETGFHQNAQMISDVAHGAAMVCGAASLVLLAGAVTGPAALATGACAIGASLLAGAADADMAAHGDAGHGWDAVAWDVVGALPAVGAESSLARSEYYAARYAKALICHQRYVPFRQQAARYAEAAMWLFGASEVVVAHDAAAIWNRFQ
jgi:RHS repeat-associated protein